MFNIIHASGHFILMFYTYRHIPTNYKNKKYSIYFNKFKTNQQTLVNLFFKNGLKLKYTNVYSNVWYFFFMKFLFFNESYNKTFPLYQTFYNLSKSNLIFYVLEYFYQLLFEKFISIFFVKIAAIPKKLKKKKKTQKYNIYYFYLKPWNRTKWVLKQISQINVCYNFTKFLFRLHFSVITAILSPDENFLKEQRLRIYKNVLRAEKLDS